jgi:S-DNA-T family DNA segregation ATPase FtsK/SpoIIIE
MAKRKKRVSRKTKNSKPNVTHTLPDGFWPQVGAVVLVVLALLLTLGAFGSGGPFPQTTYDVGRNLFGLVVYILPILFVYRAIQIFQAEHNRVPGVVTGATILFVIVASGFVQLMQVDPVAFDRSYDDGGITGWLYAQGALTVVNAQVGALISVIILLITSLFVLSVSPRSIIDWFINLFRREDSPLAQANAAVAEKVAASDLRPSKAIGELKLNQGVPTIDGMDEDKKGSRLGSLRNSIQTDKTAEEQAALTTATDPNWEVPSMELLEKKQSPADAGDVKHNAQIIKDTLDEFGIDVEMEGANIGPKVTQYTLKPPSGVKLTRITQLETNIALNLAAQALRIEAPIPGQRAVGIEVPNRKAADVRLYGILNSSQWKTVNEPLGFAIGKDIAGDAVIGELNKMPHLLIAGQTGSGKSVMINTLLTSLLYRNSPSDMRLILVDPKQVEMAPYEDIPHLLTPIITEPEKCISALKWAVNEMERRYSLLAEQKLRDIKSYNAKNTGEAMPYIVIVIDELADLMMVAARDVEALVVRLAQKARAVGIHLVLATQRPSVDVITGLIKANVPARIAFTVASQVDSRTILDQVGAEKLLGQGDMLILTPSMNKPKRIQGAWVTDDEVVKITDHLRLQRPPQYDDEIVAQPVQLNGKGGIVMDHDAGSGDEDMYKDAVRVVVEAGKASTSLLQRRLRIGYGRAARIIEEMEEQGIVGSASGSKPRDVLITSIDDVYGGNEDSI